MKAAVLSSPKKIAVKEVEAPKAFKDEVLIRVKACAICTTDRRWYSGVSKISYPAILGHEVSGIVESAVGENSGLNRGDRVAAGGPFARSCGHCIYCKMGFENQCMSLKKKSLRSGELLSSGGFGEYFVFPIKGVYRISDKITFEEAALAESLSCVIHSFKKANVSFGSSVFIVGAGPMGLLHLMLAKLKGCKTIVSDTDDKRRKLAENIGADVTASPLDENFYEKIGNFIQDEIVEGIFITAGNKDAIEQAFKIGKKLSTIVLYGSVYPAAIIELSSEIHYSENIFTGSRSQTALDFLEAVKLLSSQAIDVKPLISKVIPLNEIESGFNIRPKDNIQRIVVKL